MGAGAGAAGAHHDQQPRSEGGFGRPVGEDRFEQRSDVSRTEHQEPPARVEHSYEQQTPPADQQFGRHDQHDQLGTQQDARQGQEGELPPQAPDYGDPLDRPLQDGSADGGFTEGGSAEDGSAEDGTHRG